MSNAVKKGLVLAGVLAVGATQASAGVLSADVAVDMTDITFIFGGLITFGVTWYALKKAKSLIGA